MKAATLSFVGTSLLFSVHAQAAPTAGFPEAPNAGSPPVAAEPLAPTPAGDATPVPAAPSAEPPAPDAPPAAPPPEQATPVPPAPSPSPEPPPSLAVPAHPPLAAEPGPPPPYLPRGVHEHDGFYFRVGLGLSFVADSIRSDRFDEASFSGVGFADEIAVGGTIGRGFVLGVGIDDAGAIKPTLYIDGKHRTDGPNQLGLGLIGAFADYYFDPSRGLHAQALLGAAILTADDDRDLPVGFGGSLGIGYEWWTGAQGSIGILARLSYANLRYDPDGFDERHSVIAPAILGNFTYH